MRRNWLASLVVALVVSGLLWGGNAGALWEPHELGVAELARRIALNLLGGAGLELPGAENSLPIRSDLGRGELPFTSVALGFRMFGLHDWAGRLPLFVWSLLGLASVHVALSRLWDRRTALYGVLILASTPLYFLQARTLLGDAATLASFAMAWSGLSVALLAPTPSNRARLGFALLGALGLYAGFWCRGPIVSVAVPALSVALAALLAGAAPGRAPRMLALATLAVGVCALGLGCAALEQRGGPHYSVWVGATVSASLALSSFEVPLTTLVHACFPWSAAAPLALALPWGLGRDGNLISAPAAAAALALGGSLAVAAWLGPSLDSVPLAGVTGLAVLVAAALRELERSRSYAAPLALLVAALAIVIGFDLRVHPDKALSAFGLVGLSLPEALGSASRTLWTASALGLAAIVVWSLFEHESVAREAPLSRFERAEYSRVIGALQRVWDGNLVFALVVIEAALVGFLLLSAISERLVPLPQLDAFGSFWRGAVGISAVAVPLLPLVPVGTLLLRDLGRAFFSGDWLGARAPLTPTRAQGVLAAGLAIGATTSLWFYPALSRQVAPKEIFERFAELRQPGEPLGRLGQQEGDGRYHGGLGSVQLADVPEAFSWLTAAGQHGPRRWLLLGKSDLGELNAAFRERHLGNVPILDARSSEVLLATNRLARGERDQNPLSVLVLDRAPPPQHPVRAVLGDRKLEVLGWSVSSAEGPVARLRTATRYRFVIYFRVLDTLSGDWQVFVHLDGLQQRFNADHEPLEGKYPLALWRKDDVLADATDLVLEPTFAPGRYSVYFGLFSGERRIDVSEGPEVDDRVVAGTLEIN